MSVMGSMSSTLVFLTAAVVAVPVFKRLKLGAILGYLVAGVIIGPAALQLVSDPDDILHFAELGVVLLLFVIGLELEPDKLWRMRNQILFVGGGQLVISAIVIIAALLALFTMTLSEATVIGLALALSSTAFAVQLLNEHRIFKLPAGQSGFAILLMQDLAVIPILLVVEAMASSGNNDAPAWWISLAAIVGVLAVGRFLINPFLRLVSRYGSQEIMTAAALLIVIATATVMESAGLSMGMGAFVAGMLLANSSFKHQLETEIEPFKGLLLGLFFIAIGMKLDLALLIDSPVFIIAAASALVLVKLGIIVALLKTGKHATQKAITVGLMLSQGGEFAFVVMTHALSNGVLSANIANYVTLIVGVSMAMTSPLVMIYNAMQGRKPTPQQYDSGADVGEPEVIICGFGRFGQITARLLTANGIPYTALDKNAQHIEFVKKFENKVFFGDASRLDLLEAAGLAHARIVFIAINSDTIGYKIAQAIREAYPDIVIVARAHSRFSYMRLRQLGVTNVVREMFSGSLEAAEMVLKEYGFDDAKAAYMAQVFRCHDEEMLTQTMAEQLDEKSYIEFSKQGRQQLQSLFNDDKSIT